MKARHARPARLFACGLTASCILLAASPSVAQAPPGLAGTVTVPLAEYDRLLDRAAHPPALPPVSPVPSAVARADLALRVGSDGVRGTVTVQGDVWRDATVTVPLMRGGTVIDAVQGALRVPLLSDSGTIAALVRGPSSFSIAVSWGAELASEPGRAVAVLPAVHAGSVHATIDLPGENADVRVERGIVSSRSAGSGRTTVGITLEPGVASRVSWSSRESAAATPREVRLVSDVKTLVTIAENEIRLGVLFDVTVTQGEPEALVVLLPAGFAVAGLTGASVESEGARDGALRLAVRERSRRRHQFLLALERTAPAGTSREEIVVPAVTGVQRETGEIALEATGTVELDAVESGPLRRLDVSEVGEGILSLARSPLLAAFRYQRRDGERVPVAFAVKRFADAPVIPAAAERADVTTLVTTEGRTLTEVSLVLRNRGQLFMKVGLPAGASLVSAEVAGQSVKPVEGSDGARVPLVRPGFQTDGAYTVSFVYVAGGTALGKKGQATLSLARMDVPVNLVQWELFVPDRYEVRRFEGDAIRQDLVGQVFLSEGEFGADEEETSIAGAPLATQLRMDNLRGNQIGGFCVDSAGAVMPGVTVTVTQGSFRRTATTDARGSFVLSDVPPGPLTIAGEIAGFLPVRYRATAGGPPILMTFNIAQMAETVSVVAEAPRVEQKAKEAVPSQAASQNVLNLQRRVSGVLPVRIDVPRAGRSYVLIRPLVVEEPTTVTFEYRTR